MTSLIRRTYNRHGDHDYLTRMEGDAPVWCGDRNVALRLDGHAAEDVSETIAAYRDWLCPDGIPGVEIIPA